MKKTFILFAICGFLLSSCGYEYEQPQSEQQNSIDDSNMENNENEQVENGDNSNDIQEVELTEEEYKELCVEMYNDDFFKSTPDVGKYVKVHIMASSKYKYSSSDVQGIIVEDITEQYNLAMNCLGCTVMHESTKDDTVPSYFGKQIYIMFVDGSELNLDTFKTGQKLVIYGEIIQNKNGTFILPKYYEEEE